MVEVLRRAGVHTNSSIADAGCWNVSGGSGPDRQRHTILFGQINCVPGFNQIGTSDHHFGTAGILCTLDDILQVIVVNLFPVVTASKDWISQVDANLTVSAVGA